MLKRLYISIFATSAIAFKAFAAQPFIPYCTDSVLSMMESVNFMNADRLLPMEEHDDNAACMQLVADLLNEASQHMGIRYVRGGKTPKGFDCSGFTSYVFRQFGYSLSASSKGQFGQGVEINPEDVRPGDLLFFKGRNSRTVGHVAIAVNNDPESGDISFIHAAVKGGIRIDRVSTPYYSKRYIGARRVIDKL
ncbi:MAG: C40 family peptidase [Muribaculaceae bacterium]|nr:C40 family peptidase [Muribaculaceae bacterium]